MLTDLDINFSNHKPNLSISGNIHIPKAHKGFISRYLCIKHRFIPGSIYFLLFKIIAEFGNGYFEYKNCMFTIMRSKLHIVYRYYQ